MGCAFPLVFFKQEILILFMQRICGVFVLPKPYVWFALSECDLYLILCYDRAISLPSIYNTAISYFF